MLPIRCVEFLRLNLPDTFLVIAKILSRGHAEIQVLFIQFAFKHWQALVAVQCSLVAYVIAVIAFYAGRAQSDFYSRPSKSACAARPSGDRR